MGSIQQVLFATAPVISTTFATWDPVNSNSNVGLSNGNLSTSSSAVGAGDAISTISKSAGKWYWEIQLTSATAGALRAGIGNSSMNLSNGIGSDANGWGYIFGTGQIINNNSPTAYGSALAQNDVLGIELDMNAGTLIFTKNGTSLGTAFTGLTGSIFAVVGDSAQGGRTTTANFGATAFAESVPSGYNSGLYN